MWMDYRNVVFALAALLPGLLLAGCESTPPTPYHAELTFSHLGRIRLDVARVEVATRYVPPLTAPNVEHRAPVPPYTAMRRWAGQRLKAAGRRYSANLVILEASIKGVPVGIKGGVKKQGDLELGGLKGCPQAILLSFTNSLWRLFAKQQ